MGVYEDIVAWSASRPAWQQDALRRMATQGPLDSADIAALADLAVDGGSVGGGAPAPDPLTAEHLPSTGTATDPARLLEIATTNVNALATSSGLSFGEAGLTVVYGDNGSGKSGYVRILKHVCRARGAAEAVLPNVFTATRSQPSAAIRYRAGEHLFDREWRPGEAVADPLGTVSVFDRTCAAVYVEGENEVAYRPLGLDLLDALAQATRDVRASLDARRGSLQQPWAAVPPDLRQAKALASAWPTGAPPDPETIASATFDEADRSTLEGLERALALQGRLDARTGLAAIHAQYGAARRACETATSAVSTAHELLEATREASRTEAVAAAARGSAAGGGSLPDVGGGLWRAMWDAAERYSADLAYPGSAFPHVDEGALCVLCAQAIGSEAARRFRALRGLVERDVETAARASRAKVDRLRPSLESSVAEVARYRDGTPRLPDEDPGLLSRLDRFLAWAQDVARRALEPDDGDRHEERTKAPDSPLDTLTTREKAIADELMVMDRVGDPSQAAEVRAEILELRARSWLVEHRDDLLAERARAEGLRRVIDAVGTCDTQPITMLAGRLTDEHVTATLRTAFEQELENLQPGQMPIRIVQRGGYGSAFHHLELGGSQGTSARVADVASDGEFRAIALASFLAEVANSGSGSAIVLDDPVTSLDHLYRDRVAARLAREAVARQVIVFTHDLVFLSDLIAAAEAEGVQLSHRTVQKVGAEAGIARDGHPWHGMKVNARLQQLDERINDLRALHECGDLDAYGREVSRWYSDLRATWERAVEEVLFADAIGRFRAQVKTQSLSSNRVWRMEERDIDEIDLAMTKASAMTEAHDTPAAINRRPPDPAELRADVQQCRDWVGTIKDRRRD